jgi:hypothetical protein
MKAKMLALTIVPTSSKKPKLAFHVGFNPTQSELIMDFLRASQVDHERPTTDRSPPCPQRRYQSEALRPN